jgi:hypothetical protein
VVPVSSIAAGEYAENEMRKEFTPSERVAILETIERMRQHDNQYTKRNGPAPVPNLATASKAVGFGSYANRGRGRTVINSIGQRAANAARSAASDRRIS